MWKIFAFLVRAAENAIRHHYLLDHVLGEQRFDLLGHLRVAKDIGADKTLKDWLGSILQEDSGHDLGAGFVVRAVAGAGADREFALAGFLRTAEFEFLPAAAGQGS